MHVSDNRGSPAAKRIPCYNVGFASNDSKTNYMNHLKRLIREVPDFPKPGVNFFDITTLLKDKEGFHETIEALKSQYHGRPVDVVAGIEARGYFFAPAVALALNAGFI